MLGCMHRTDIVFPNVVQTSTLQYCRVPAPLPSRPLGVSLDFHAGVIAFQSP